MPAPTRQMPPWPRRLGLLAAFAAAATLALLLVGVGSSRPEPPPLPAVAPPGAPCRAGSSRTPRHATIAVLAKRGHEPHANLAVTTPRPWVALTFDDGPWPATTPAVLRTLGRFHAHATFFVIGLFAARYPALLRRERAAGHEVANHTLDHRPLADVAGGSRLRPAEIRNEIDGGRNAICRAGLPAPAFFRPPYGHGMFSRRIAAEARAVGERTVGWDVALDRFLLSRPTIEAAVSGILAQVRPGTIILLHDGHVGKATHAGTLAALPRLLAGLRARGLEAVSLSRLLG
jgi:peptidoglycan/xylan/chitin deacetylase (PgdA/CDA1 family)